VTQHKYVDEAVQAENRIMIVYCMSIRNTKGGSQRRESIMYSTDVWMFRYYTSTCSWTQIVDNV